MAGSPLPGKSGGAPLGPPTQPSEVAHTTLHEDASRHEEDPAAQTPAGRWGHASYTNSHTPDSLDSLEDPHPSVSLASEASPIHRTRELLLRQQEAPESVDACPCLRCMRRIAKSPRFFLKASLYSGGWLLLLLLLAFYATFVADRGPHAVAPRLLQAEERLSESFSRLLQSTPPRAVVTHEERLPLSHADGDGSANGSNPLGGAPLAADGGGDLWSLLQMPLLSGAPLLQPTQSPIRKRTETMRHLFGPERQLTSLLIVTQASAGKGVRDSGGLHAGDTSIAPRRSAIAEKPLNAGPPERCTYTSDGDEGLLEPHTLESVWRLTKGFEAETYGALRWRDVCKLTDTDFVLGEVCVAMGIFGIFEAAFGPIASVKDFEDAMNGMEFQRRGILLLAPPLDCV
ncbi:cholesterol transporter related protein with 12 transmembrane domain [Cyclospora cayetanensis]|uniref:Cholesterol transporter related protein with 12 transmembrane domain n=1 Tax=Cyclospora cayetanensis TaxID=88456 RepID=A0A1D3CUS5_9EIME|nr:cholesterol transporter related protein with 12 transmembrane domain [Cyclospora cayetanensis]